MQATEHTKLLQGVAEATTQLSGWFDYPSLTASEAPVSPILRSGDGRILQ